jgi:hypothetical protein
LPERVCAYAEAQWERPSVHEFFAVKRGTYVPYAGIGPTRRAETFRPQRGGAVTIAPRARFHYVRAP